MCRMLSAWKQSRRCHGPAGRPFGQESSCPRGARPDTLDAGGNHRASSRSCLWPHDQLEDRRPRPCEGPVAAAEAGSIRATFGQWRSSVVVGACAWARLPGCHHCSHSLGSGDLSGRPIGVVRGQVLRTFGGWPQYEPSCLLLGRLRGPLPSLRWSELLSPWWCVDRRLPLPGGFIPPTSMPPVLLVLSGPLLGGCAWLQSRQPSSSEFHPPSPENGVASGTASPWAIGSGGCPLLLVGWFPSASVSHGRQQGVQDESGSGWCRSIATLTRVNVAVSDLWDPSGLRTLSEEKVGARFETTLRWTATLAGMTGCQQAVQWRNAAGELQRPTGEADRLRCCKQQLDGSGVSTR